MQDDGIQKMMNIQNAQKDCTKEDFWKNAFRIGKKVIHNWMPKNARKLSYTRSYARYPQNQSDFFAHFFCWNKRLFC